LKVFCYLVILCVVFSFVTGCGSGVVTVYPVTGEVIYEGKPVKNAMISFVPKSSDGRGASAQTTSDGTFIAATQGATKNGAMTGEYVVLISKWVSVDSAGNELPPPPPKEYNPQDEELPPPEPIRKNLLPSKYEQKESSDLNIVVERKKNHFKFELK
jgi:hypothetical protein